MKNWSNPLRFAKCVFFTLLVSSGLFLLKSALVFRSKETTTGDATTKKQNIVKNHTTTDDATTKKQNIVKKHKNDSILYVPQKFSDDYTSQMVRSDFRGCILQPSKTFCVGPQKNTVFSGYEYPLSFAKDQNFADANFSSSNGKSSKGSSGHVRRLHPVHATFVAFIRFCKALSIKPVLIEPSVVFCILKQDIQNMLMKRRFNITSWMGEENVLTFAINEDDSSKLSHPTALKELLLTDFTYWSIGMGETDDSSNVSSGRHRSLKTHHFFIHRRIVIHAVVFYQRKKYLWHGGITTLPHEILNYTPIENLLFSKYEAIYERFLPLEVPAEPVLETLYIPSDPRLFLQQVEHSRFLYCNLSNALYVNQTVKKHHDHMTKEKFVQMTHIAIQEMKVQLHPELMTFWIMGGTLLGWYRECGLIQYTTDVDFAAWATDIDDAQKLAKKFKSNKHLKLREIMGLTEEALEYNLNCHGLRVDLFFCYDDGERYWVSGHRPSKGYYFPYYYPKFTLCSADLLGHKVQVPCDTLKVILADYGADWEKPISSWNYEASPKNMGKRRYWYEEEKSFVYVSYT